MPRQGHFATDDPVEARMFIRAMRVAAQAAGWPPPYRRWVTFLDGRECRLCHELDGTVWPHEAGPRVPLHARCRCHSEPAALRDLVRRAQGATEREFRPDPRPRPVIRSDRKRRIFVVHRERGEPRPEQ